MQQPDYSLLPTAKLVELVMEKLGAACSAVSSKPETDPDRVDIEEFLRDLPKAYELVKGGEYPENLFRYGLLVHLP